MYSVSNEDNLHKDLKIQTLSKAQEASKAFSKFSKHFTKEQISGLNQIPGGISGDSTVVNKCLRFLYEKDIVLLKSIGVTEQNGKKPICPDKKKSSNKC